jgi:hypothetical protein
MLVSKDKRSLRVDLSGLTFVDDAGKACLAAMYHEGADLVANDCLTQSIVDEIRSASIRRIIPFERADGQQGEAQ